ncbi:NAD-dependent histone deacetylase HST4 [Kluyveromyces lactis]|uniref:KLLA0D18535p n=1 Tax=Kluyveromyces lactis (strain ATCC 8585 / CBS 2359 / DSM 70799 / NBRC 1267 / NRRL Y-1140 / WM37) TaxID=284590 RepID=Q6CQA7_KLULA|nr:uncharacterized protein KLLA0_D18535g [Kluyveromyces lactis]CAH00978.1 KLLA0D18535p [Kluyveromyces lactis]|eukprot:XP_453882.1 uncharacterized protein KLLA0_D18535g [Kluyveromyces lactis]
MESPVRKEYHQLLTPPSSSVKKHDLKAGDLKELSIKPRKLINDLSRVKKSPSRKKKLCDSPTTRSLPQTTRKPRLKYRPELDTVFPLDNYVEGSAKSSSKDAEFLTYVLSYSKRIVVVQGAGVSVAAGIPDFRSANGLFTTLKSSSPNVKSGKDLFDFNHVYSSNSMSISFNSLMSKLHSLSCTSKPTAYHSFINQLCEKNQVKRIYSQNIDGLETKFQTTSANESPKNPQVVQLHGSIHHMSCMKCRKKYDMDPSMFKTDEDAETGEIVPQCPECKEFESVRSVCGKRLQGVGRLKPSVVLYNEYHPEGDIISEMMNKDLKSNPDALLIVGTSLKIPGVRQMVKQFATKVRAKKGFIIWVNNELPPPNIKTLLNRCDLVVLGDCQNLPVLMEQENINL